METVTLKNGAEELNGLVQTVMFSLQDLLKQYPAQFFELVTLSRQPQHKLWGSSTIGILQSLALLGSDGRLHGSIRNIVLSATEGDGLEMKLVSPFKQEPTP